jgi:hypothetical protein
MDLTLRTAGHLVGAGLQNYRGAHGGNTRERWQRLIDHGKR